MREGAKGGGERGLVWERAQVARPGEALRPGPRAKGNANAEKGPKSPRWGRDQMGRGRGLGA